MTRSRFLGDLKTADGIIWRRLRPNLCIFFLGEIGIGGSVPGSRLGPDTPRRVINIVVVGTTGPRENRVGG